MMAGGATSIIIFGATGDLARRKLLPALFLLWCKGRLPASFRIVGLARREYSDDKFRDLMVEGVQEFADLAPLTSEWAAFARNIFYAQGELDSPESYVVLRRRLEELEGRDGSANRLFYLSVAPRFFGSAIDNLGAAGLARQERGWSRVVIEKPIGHDLESAKSLNQSVHRVFEESQIYRIDHYLGKETVQNLLVFRFNNRIFEPLWNREHVESVQITAAETVSVGDRAGYCLARHAEKLRGACCAVRNLGFAGSG